MFDTLGNRLNEVFDRLRGRGALGEDDVAAAMREIRIALLEADVALPVVRDFIAAVREKAVGQDVVRSVTPGQMVVKIVHDHLVAVLGGDEPRGRSDSLDLNAAAPVAVMLVGLQGSGKTTTAAKIALRLKNRERKKVLMASLDVQRPAAQEQLAQLGRQTGVATLPVVAGERPVAITRRALQMGRTEGYDVVLLAAKLQKGNFDLDDLAGQLRQIRRMGGMGGMLGMLPGVGKIKKQMAEANIDEGIIKRQEAIIGSMTKSERKNPKLLNGSRRRRIASGSGTSVPDVNRLLKQYQDMAGMMKKMKKLGQKGLMRHGLSALMPQGFRH